MNQILRFFFIIFITFIIVLFVTDFQAVVDGFGSLVDGISTVLSPLKGAVK
ncbi:MAG: hypothetical protein SGJ00_00945 [bacterium]|nr:hypothetical protein [bacterium]